jgi:hypothetical protein
MEIWLSWETQANNSVTKLNRIRTIPHFLLWHSRRTGARRDGRLLIVLWRNGCQLVQPLILIHCLSAKVVIPLFAPLRISVGRMVIVPAQHFQIKSASPSPE